MPLLRSGASEGITRQALKQNLSDRCTPCQRVTVFYKQTQRVPIPSSASSAATTASIAFFRFTKKRPLWYVTAGLPLYVSPPSLPLLAAGYRRPVILRVHVRDFPLGYSRTRAPSTKGARSATSPAPSLPKARPWTSGVPGAGLTGPFNGARRKESNGKSLLEKIIYRLLYL